jgi:hypothetical protein
MNEEEEEEENLEEHVKVIREGHGANCSSIGSVIDTLFIAQVTAGALLAVVAASLAAKTEDVEKKKPEPAKEEDK